jgi:hypothetical protein
MPIDPDIVEHHLGHPGPDCRTAWVRTGVPGRARRFDGLAIPLDGRAYIVHGTTFLASGQHVQSRFELDTSRPDPLADSLWHIDDRWYVPFEPAALERLGVSEREARPFRWMTNVRLRSLESPPYEEGQALHAPGRTWRAPWWKSWGPRRR